MELKNIITKWGIREKILTKNKNKQKKEKVNLKIGHLKKRGRNALA